MGDHRRIILDPNKSNVVQVQFKIDPWVHEALRRSAWDRSVHINGLMRDIFGAFVSTVCDFTNPEFWEKDWPPIDLPPERYPGYRASLYPYEKRSDGQ